MSSLPNRQNLMSFQKSIRLKENSDSVRQVQNRFAHEVHQEYFADLEINHLKEKSINNYLIQKRVLVSLKQQFTNFNSQESRLGYQS